MRTAWMVRWKIWAFGISVAVHSVLGNAPVSFGISLFLGPLTLAVWR